MTKAQHRIKELTALLVRARTLKERAMARWEEAVDVVEDLEIKLSKAYDRTVLWREWKRRGFHKTSEGRK